MPKRSSKVFDFTPREKMVAALLAKGESRKKIASELKISVRTVDDFILRIRQKLEAESMFVAGIILSHYRIR